MKTVTLICLAHLFLFAISTVSYSQACPESEGCLDGDFGSGGSVLVNIPGYANAAPDKMAVQSDGKIVVLARGEILFRVNSDGSVDANFGSAGYVYVQWPDGLASSAKTVALQGDGKIVIAGWSPATRGMAMRFERYNSDGSLDSGTGGDSTPNDQFGNAGAVMIHNTLARSLAIQGDGKIVALGADGSLVRLLSNGSPDPGFGKSGVATTKLAFETWFNGLVILPSGRIAASGALTAGNVRYFAVIGFNANGSPDDGSKNDTTKGDAFGTAGKIVVNFSGYSGGYARAMKLDASGRIMVVGDAGTPPSTAVGIVRLTTAGQLDNTFGTGGRSVKSESLFANAIGMQSDGRIVVFGSSSRNGQNDAAIYRFNSDGSQDTFGGAAIVTSDPFGYDDTSRDGVVRIDPSCGCERALWLGTSSPNPTSVWYPLLLQFKL